VALAAALVVSMLNLADVAIDDKLRSNSTNCPAVAGAAAFCRVAFYSPLRSARSGRSTVDSFAFVEIVDSSELGFDAVQSRLLSPVRHQTL
jgi:hypothetical protein